MSSKLNGVCGVDIPCAIVVKLLLGRALVLSALRSHSERCVFGTCELLKLDSCCDFRWSFLFCQSSGQGKSDGRWGMQRHIFMLLRKKLNSKRCLWKHFVWKGMGEGVKESFCRRSLPPKCTFLFEVFSLYGKSVMSEAPISIIARDTSRQYPVFQSLYRGFPHLI